METYIFIQIGAGGAPIIEQILNGQKGTEITFGSSYSTRYQLCLSTVEGWSTRDPHQKCLHICKQVEDEYPGSQVLELRLLPALPFKEVEQTLLCWNNSSGRFHHQTERCWIWGYIFLPLWSLLGRNSPTLSCSHACPVSSNFPCLQNSNSTKPLLFLDEGHSHTD